MMEELNIQQQYVYLLQLGLHLPYLRDALINDQSMAMKYKTY